jgi:hypothetical protein
VLTAVQLDDHRCFQAHKIADVRANRALTPEFEAAQLASLQTTPETPFGFGRVITQLAGVIIHPLILTMEMRRKCG